MPVYHTLAHVESSEEPPGKRPSRNPFAHTFRALTNRNFRLFVSGQLISLVGTHMQQVAMSWLVYRLTGNVFLLGLIAFLGQGPGFFIAPFAGTLADRLNRRQLLVLTQSLSMVQALILAYLAFSGHVQVWHLLALGMMMGLITGLDTPVRQAFVVDLLEKPEDLSNAISLNSSVFNASRLIGPAIAGLAIISVGEGWCFLLNGISYSAVIVALLAMKLPHKEILPPQTGYLKGIQEGVAYAYRVPAIRAILLLVALVSLVGLPYTSLMPVYVKTILHGGADTLGYLMGTAGAGALTGAIYLASRREVLGLIRVIPVAAGVFGVGLIGFAFSKLLWLSFILLYMAGLGMMVQFASSNILLQTLSDNPLRGRVMSLYAMAFLGLTPFGSLLVGSLAHQAGVLLTLQVGGCLCIVGAALFARRLPHLNLHKRPHQAHQEIDLSTTKEDIPVSASAFSSESVSPQNSHNGTEQLGARP